MYWTKPGHEFDLLFERMLKEETQYRLWGAAELGHRFIEEFQGNFGLCK